jgi:hypothetical protein
MNPNYRLLTIGLLLAAASASQAIAQVADDTKDGFPASVPESGSSLLLAGAALTGLLWVASRKFRK